MNPGGNPMSNDFDEHSPAEPVVGDVLALRSFRIDISTQTLGGLSYHQEIAPGINVAQCAHNLDDDTHPVPNNGCTCGWYAYDEIRHWGSNGGHPNHSRPAPTRASGIVRLSGRVIVCNRGLKAENMEIVALTVHPQDASMVQQLFPAVELFDDEEQMIKAYPLTRLERNDSSTTTGQGLMARIASWFTRNGPIASFAVKHWQSMTAQATFPEIVRWAGFKLILAMLGFAVLFAINDTAATTYPKGSASGFGPLIPLGVLVLLSPVVNLWRSVIGLIAFLLLLHHGIVNSAPALETFMTDSGITNMQAAVAILALYGVPICLLFWRGVVLYSRFRDGMLPPPATVTHGSAVTRRAGGATGRAVVGAIPSARLTFLQNRLPKKTKTVSPEGPDNNAQES